MNQTRISALVAALVGIAGCATQVFNSPANEPLSVKTEPNMGAPQREARENAIVMSFSGGGLRAAAFAHGALTALANVKTDEGDLLDDVSLITSASGGSLTAAHYGLYGREGLARFRSEVLLPGFEDDMRTTLYNPVNLMRALGGGVNTRENLGATLDRRVFHGATFADLFRHQRPEIRIHATDLYHRVPFAFHPTVFSLLCSDLSRYPVSDAVAASMAVPVVFVPVVVRTYPERCEPLPPSLASFRVRPGAPRVHNAMARAVAGYRDPQVRYIKLVDGGLTDNFAVSTLVVSRMVYGTPYAPLTESEAVSIRRLLLVVVDASRGPSGDWTLHEAGPAGLDLALAATATMIETSAEQYADSFSSAIREWQDAVIAYRCSLKPADVVRLGGPKAWACADVKFSLATLSIDDLERPVRERLEAIPTRLALPAEQIDAAIEGGRIAALSHPGLRVYVRERALRHQARTP